LRKINSFIISEKPIKPWFTWSRAVIGKILGDQFHAYHVKHEIDKGVHALNVIFLRMINKKKDKPYLLEIPMLYLAAKLSAFFSLPWVQRFGNKYPRVFRFVIRRFDMQDFLGLPLTLLLLIIFANFSLLNELAENVVNSESMKAVDRTVTLWLYNRRTPLISQAFYYFTQLGSQYGVVAITLLSSLLLLIRHKGFYLIALILSVLGSSCSMYLLKLYFHRERPLKVYYVPEASFSFPSGHATGAMALEGIILYFLMIESRSKQQKNNWLIAGVTYILAIGFSRIYLGVHFLTDVLGGYLVGFLWVLVSIGIMEFLALRKAKENSRLEREQTSITTYSGKR